MLTKIFHALLISSMIIVNAIADTITLEQYNIEPDTVTVSGISSGAAMATQMHVSFSEDIVGAAMFDGVPYYCARNKVEKFPKCMKNFPGTPVEPLIALTKQFSDFGEIDDTDNLEGDKVYVFAGTEDFIVDPGNGPKIEQFYHEFKANLKTEFTIAANHCQPIDNDDPMFQDCVYSTPSAPLGDMSFICDCGFSGAYHALNHLYGGNLIMPAGVAYSGQFETFDQEEFLPSDSSMDSYGFVYIPTQCDVGPCKLHVVFHACFQGRTFDTGSGATDEKFARNSGYLEVADLNNIILLFPQIVATPLNIKGCWDWWGYTDSKYAQKLGKQPLAVSRMINRVVHDW